jgi:hypothetical protein
MTHGEMKKMYDKVKLSADCTSAQIRMVSACLELFCSSVAHAQKIYDCSFQKSELLLRQIEERELKYAQLRSLINIQKVNLDRAREEKICFRGRSFQ